MSAIPGIAVFDIGKTNKKFFFFDEDYQIVEETSQAFDETVDEDGFPCDDIRRLTEWMKDTLDVKLKDPRFLVKAINFSTYGASFVHLNGSGAVLTPLYNYLKPFPKELAANFYPKYGGAELFATETASPVLGNLNSGLQLYRIKEQQPELFDQIKTSLHLPQYMGYLVHGELFSDITSIGCHTALWNFNNNHYHRWVAAEGIGRKLAPVFSSKDTITATVNGVQLRCGVGLHDSSAAFIPYMQVIKESFILLSTGTWCISMNPFNRHSLTARELAQDCLAYLTYNGSAVKSSRLFSGNEHEQEVKKLAEHFNVAPRYFHSIPYDPQLVDGNPDDAIVEVFQFSGSGTAEKAYHDLMLHLIKKQKRSTQLVLEDAPVKQLYVDGGFARNAIFMNLLAKAFPQLEVYAASVSQATAVGAALAIHSSWNAKDKIDHLVEVKRYRAGA